MISISGRSYLNKASKFFYDCFRNDDHNSIKKLSGQTFIRCESFIHFHNFSWKCLLQISVIGLKTAVKTSYSVNRLIHGVQRHELENKSLRLQRLEKFFISRNFDCPESLATWVIVQSDVTTLWYYESAIKENFNSISKIGSQSGKQLITIDSEMT